MTLQRFILPGYAAIVALLIATGSGTGAGATAPAGTARIQEPAPKEIPSR
jgi:hypothetical protein